MYTCQDTRALMFFPFLQEFSFTSKFSLMNFASGCTCANQESGFMFKVRKEINSNSLIADIIFLITANLFKNNYLI